MPFCSWQVWFRRCGSGEGNLVEALSNKFLLVDDKIVNRSQDKAERKRDRQNLPTKVEERESQAMASGPPR
jgi:hypothetical protein